MISSFQGNYRFLSNFWLADVVFEGETYRSNEHAYVAAKTLDPAVRDQVRLVFFPGHVKKLGRQIQLRADWEQIKLQVMEDLVRYKFTHHPNLANELHRTGDQMLIEGNTWGDTFWGMCRGRGENHLGKILMKVREELR